MAQPPMTNPTGEDRRRSPRVRLAIPVDVEWTGEDQVPVREHAETEVLNAYGGLPAVGRHLPPGGKAAQAPRGRCHGARREIPTAKCSTTPSCRDNRGDKGKTAGVAPVPLRLAAQRGGDKNWDRFCTLYRIWPPHQ